MTTPTDVSVVIGAMGDVFDLTGTVIAQIAAQPILLMVLAAGMIPVGIRLFKQLFSAAKRR